MVPVGVNIDTFKLSGLYRQDNIIGKIGVGTNAISSATNTVIKPGYIVNDITVIKQGNMLVVERVRAKASLNYN